MKLNSTQIILTNAYIAVTSERLAKSRGHSPVAPGCQQSQTRGAVASRGRQLNKTKDEGRCRRQTLAVQLYSHTNAITKNK